MICPDCMGFRHAGVPYHGGGGGLKNYSVTVESIASTMLYVPRLEGV